MPLLKSQNTKVTYKRERVDVPEFGTDEATGEVFYVFVRKMSMAEQKDVVQSATWIDRAAQRILFNYPQVASLTAVSGQGTDTDRGVRVFPSEQFITDLTPEYEPAIRRIALKALELSALIAPQAEHNGTEPTALIQPDPVDVAKNA